MTRIISIAICKMISYRYKILYGLSHNIIVYWFLITLNSLIEGLVTHLSNFLCIFVYKQVKDYSVTN